MVIGWFQISQVPSWNYEHDYPRIVRNEVLLPINWINNKMWETLELKIQNKGSYTSYQCIISLNDRGYSFERNCVLRRWESETLK